MSTEDVPTERSESEAGWVLDSLVGFLKGPIWNLPIQSFVEHKSVVFEPDEEGNEDEYRKIFEDYKHLVDRLLSSHMDDLSITTDDFEEACKNAGGTLSQKFHNTLFEQIWAANDFEIFKRMMIQRNIDLQLQALEILAQRFGLIPESFIPTGANREDYASDEDAVFEQVLKRSLDEHQQECDPDNVMREATMLEKDRLEAERDREREKFDEAMEHLMTEPIKDDGSRSEVKEMVKRVEKGVNAIDSEEIKKRQEYLRKQRDKLLEIKKKERVKQMNKMDSELMEKRPKSAKAMREAVKEPGQVCDADGDGNADKGLAFRLSLAARLKAEVVESNREQQQ